MEEIREASRIAHCDEFISEFENGYDTIVGERGVRLSGGQRQRVAIARAILADPRILILDEATSSLDSESEALIRDGLRSLRSGRTTFVIAHRLSTIASANQILVLENGEIVERGTQPELLRMGGRYKQLYDTQYRAEQDQFINPGEDFTLSRSERRRESLGASRQLTLSEMPRASRGIPTFAFLRRHEKQILRCSQLRRARQRRLRAQGHSQRHASRRIRGREHHARGVRQAVR